MGKSIFWLKLVVVIVLCINLFGCASTKYVPENEHLLNKVTLKYSDDSQHVPSLKKQIRQRPNTKVLGIFKVQLAFYNMSALFGSDLKKCLDLYHASSQNIFALIDNLKEEAVILEKKLENADIQKNNMEIQLESLKNILLEKKM